MLVIYIRDLVVEAKHGVHQREKEEAQRFVINLEVTVEDLPATVSDDLAETLNYSELRQTTIDTAQNNSFNLIERLAQAIADQILTDKRIRKLTISIDKPDVYDNGTPGIKLEIIP